MEVTNENIPSSSENASNNVSVLDTQRMNDDNQTILSRSNAAKKRLLSESPTNFLEAQNSVSNAKIKRQSSKAMFCLLVSNLPYTWNQEQITEFIGLHCVDVEGIEILDHGDSVTGQTIRLSFLNSFEDCNTVRKQLKLKTVNGRKLNVFFDVPQDSESENSPAETLLIEKCNSKPPVFSSPWQPHFDIWSPDANGIYGLKVEFLESLGITPPLDKWVHVSNFRCDKSELKEVLELAGHVVICNVVTISKKYAQVMYSHPLEAVQAVSMLNGHLFYGQVLKVSMYKCPNNESILPKGLSSVGPGLGKFGKPLRDVAREYERHLNGRSSTVDTTIFNVASNGANKSPEHRFKEEKYCHQNSGDFKSNSNMQDASGDESLKIETFVSLKKQKNNLADNGSSSAPNRLDSLWAVAQSNAPATNTYQGTNSGVENCMQANTVNRPFQVNHAPTLPYTAYGNMPNSGQIPTNTWGNVAINNMPTPPVAGPSTQLKTSTVELSNLPLTTTFPLLSEKMAQIGQVLCVEFTRTGCAVVRFASPVHAENCYKQYNNMCAMGNTIAVRFL